MATDVPRRAGPPSVPSGPPAHARVAPARKGWTAGRVLALIAGLVLIFACTVLLTGAGALTWADQEQYGGYLTTGTATYATSGYALTSDPVNLHGKWAWFGSFAEEVRIRVTPARPGTLVFVAIGPAGDVARYLTGVSHTSVAALGDHDVTQHPGSAVPASPPTALAWVAQVRGTGTQTLRWTVRSGDWVVLVMNLNSSPGITVRADAGVSSPVLPWLAGELLAAGIMAGLTGAALVLIPVRLASSRR